MQRGEDAGRGVPVVEVGREDGVPELAGVAVVQERLVVDVDAAAAGSAITSCVLRV